MKKHLSLLLVIAMALTLLPAASAGAAGEIAVYINGTKINYTAGQALRRSDGVYIPIAETAPYLYATVTEGPSSNDPATLQQINYLIAEYNDNYETIREMKDNLFEMYKDFYDNGNELDPEIEAKIREIYSVDNGENNILASGSARNGGNIDSLSVQNKAKYDMAVNAQLNQALLDAQQAQYEQTLKILDNYRSQIEGLIKINDEIAAEIDELYSPVTYYINSPGIYRNITIGDTTATINLNNYTLSKAPQKIDGIVYVPLEYIGNFFNANVEWNQYYNVVTITFINNIGTLYYPSGNVLYRGEIENGLVGGYGELYYDSTNMESLFVGHLSQNDNEIFYGQWLYRNGNTRFLGCTYRGIPHGKGYYFPSDMLSYVYGDFNSEFMLQNGVGEEYILDTSKGGYVCKYIGSFDDNFMYSGQGTLYSTYTQMPIYTGSFQNGLANGYGTLYDGYGNVKYSCNFINGYSEYGEYIG
ncbi:MAG: stalk domain-containing protein [Clostridia bacterium]